MRWQHFWSGIHGMIVMLGILCAGSYSAHADEDPLLTVLVCDSAGVPPQTTLEAQREASRVLLKAGLRTEWLDCSATHVAEEKDREWGVTCHRPRDPAHMVLEILPEPRSKGGALEATGFARLPRNGSPSVCVGVFYDRVESLARLGDASEAQLLAYLAAHEIGHVLLGPKAHTDSGIMRAEWSRADMRRAAWGLLTFEPWQAERIRSGMLMRTAASLR
jgi:hypothetical protein